MSDYTMTIDGKAESAKATFGVINPATEEIFARPPECTREQLDSAMDSAQTAYRAWSKDEAREDRSFRIVQSSPSFVWKDIKEQPYRLWLIRFGNALMGMELSYWYDQFLAKPPGRSVPTYWHQDEGYWGSNLWDKGVTGWIPLQDVDAGNGCMHFIDRGHKDGVLPHHLVEGMQSDLLTCDVDESRTVVCPISRGDVTFHHSKTPHMTTANTSKGWRKAVTNHMQEVGAGGEGDHYPWKVYVNQRTGERIVPDSR